MEGEERPPMVRRGKARPGIEEKVHRRPMAWEGDRRLGPGRAVADLGAVAAVFGRLHLPVREAVVIAERPAIVGPLIHHPELLGGELGVQGIGGAPGLAELVAAMGRHPELAGRGFEIERHRVAGPGRDAGAVALALPRAVGAETPDPRAPLALRAPGDPRGAIPSILRLAAVGRRADVHIEVMAMDRDRLRSMSPGREGVHRSEERRVGTERRSRWSPYHYN